jgi:hypothetical protein
MENVQSPAVSHSDLIEGYMAQRIAEMDSESYVLPRDYGYMVFFYRLLKEKFEFFRDIAVEHDSDFVSAENLSHENVQRMINFLQRQFGLLLLVSEWGGESDAEMRDDERDAVLHRLGWLEFDESRGISYPSLEGQRLLKAYHEFMEKGDFESIVAGVRDSANGVLKS